MKEKKQKMEEEKRKMRAEQERESRLINKLPRIAAL